MFIQDHFSNFRLKNTGRGVGIKQIFPKCKILQNSYALRVIYLQNVFPRQNTKYSRAYKQNRKPESNRQEVISTIACYKDFHLSDKFYFPQLIQEPNAIAKKVLAKRNEFSLIRADKIVMLFFMTLGMDLVMLSDKIGMF